MYGDIFCLDSRYTGHTGAVNDACFSPNGNLMASAAQDGSLALWIPTVTGESTFWKGHQAGARSIVFTPDGNQLVSSADDKTIKIWAVQKSRLIHVSYDIIALLMFSIIVQHALFAHI